MVWLDKMQWSILLIVGSLFLLAPFTPEPHLIEKSRMLFLGTLVKPIDIFDLFFHGLPLCIIAIKAYRQFVLKVEN
ncbi:hypothetical protein LNL84_08870 [Vibrio sp. ZSDZ34]|uniref:RND transporter n=1 Tax=Vibrio gelatinilyticus TaxID=2893468 RepID=A0A9X2AW82_9VIBR|nr:hypothetical protein [Vibrio gelatinilyticus]MCJ2376946.1 hypothetical protein [Vibrio gelatinilyticus]